MPINVVTPYCKDSVLRSVKVDEISEPEANSDNTIMLITLKPENKLSMHNVIIDCLLMVNSLLLRLPSYSSFCPKEYDTNNNKVLYPSENIKIEIEYKVLLEPNKKINFAASKALKKTIAARV